MSYLEFETNDSYNNTIRADIVSSGDHKSGGDPANHPPQSRLDRRDAASGIEVDPSNGMGREGDVGVSSIINTFLLVTYAWQD